MRLSSTQDGYHQAGSRVEVELILDIKASFGTPNTRRGKEKKNRKSLSGSRRTWVKSDRVMSLDRPGLRGRMGGGVLCQLLRLSNQHEETFYPPPITPPILVHKK